ncbi:MAG: hypothetical protein U5M50_08765 [Sphingobium sp.]|nr:hypothetical protein [Sphingobium sp.]
MNMARAKPEAVDAAAEKSAQSGAIDVTETSSIYDRLARLEAMVSALLQKMSDQVDLPDQARLINMGNYPPKIWRDEAVRNAVMAKHRRMTIAEAVEQIREEFGAERAPSKSALQRMWKKMDRAFARGGR